MTSPIELVVGRIGKPHGIRGEVTVEVRTDEPEERFALGAELDVKPAKGARPLWNKLTVRSRRWHQGTLLVGFVELGDRNAAEDARGTLLFIEVEPTAETGDPDAFYEHQLVGLEVRNLDGEVIGTVTGLQSGSAQDLLQIKSTDRRATLVPFVSALVPEVNVGEKYVVVADRPGLVTPFAPDEDDAAARGN